MIEFLSSIDRSIFYLINHSLANPFFDLLMPFLTDLNKQKAAQIIVLGILIVLSLRGGRKGRAFVILFLILITLSDQMSSSVLKPIFERPRPCHVLSDVHLLIPCGSGFSFPSSHAVNNFATAVLLAFFFPKWKIGWYTYAAVICFSRVYVGVHYPSDVTGGAVIGALLAFVLVQLYQFLEKKFDNRAPAA